MASIENYFSSWKQRTWTFRTYAFILRPRSAFTFGRSRLSDMCEKNNFKTKPFLVILTFPFIAVMHHLNFITNIKNL